jgi:hypothetical protein
MIANLTPFLWSYPTMEATKIHILPWKQQDFNGRGSLDYSEVVLEIVVMEMKSLRAQGDPF